MILVDTSVWIAHLRVSNPTLEDLLSRSLVLSHPFVIGEIALGDARQRKAILDLTQNLSRAIVATDEEVLLFIEQHALPGRGIGYIDAHLLASTWLTAGANLWTHDRRLHEVAVELKSAFGR
jgi:predicted nucleic acid-binding protein